MNTTKMSKRILFAILDWGLGHASRSIPIIQLLEDFETEVVIAGAGNSLELLKIRFPSLKTIELPAYNIRYPTSNMLFNLIPQSRHLVKTYFNEQRFIKNYVLSKKVDAIISDNRFGCFSHLVPTAFITHQINIQSPYFGNLINRVNHGIIKRYSECWIPDYPGANNLAGALSHPSLDSIRTRYIGSLSDFVAIETNKKYDVIVILSGPEPQRTFLEMKLLQQLQSLSLRTIVVQGKPGNERRPTTVGKHIQIIPFLKRPALNKFITESTLVICRSGYSSIMDLTKLTNPILFIPTPGQTEQIYLAKKLTNEYQHIQYQYQNSIDLRSAVDQLSYKSGTWTLPKDELLKNAVQSFLNRIV